ncbi:MULTISPECIES: protein-L-isoaspartate O-methyltransferase family protein [Nocardioides]|uniref:Protein-L-isoaspartate O-methyltransferase n=1 Tax=Nocardioides vastitatis TaxID=2568655 RepID=A0ABW0ZP54_9ACTN|nr:protein-L-isoaspartate O-methyltransferase [Nocardioides sp.]THI96052.1 protein-L-isoaspartate O-methyltransferase [Nocardioides sp.]
MGRVADALRAVAREHFLPAEQRPFAGLDKPLPIGHGVTNSQPTTVANMLELLDPQPGDHVLDVGCGSGWTSALLAHLVGPSGSVVGVELIPEVLEFGRANVGGLEGVELRQAEPGVLGWPRGAPYDRILLSADAGEFPDVLVQQLALSGVLVGPVNGEMLRVTRLVDGQVEVEEHGAYTFVPLIDRPLVDRPLVDRPDIERPDIERPDIDRPDIDRPESVEEDR